jgi:hypothetical protein
MTLFQTCQPHRPMRASLKPALTIFWNQPPILVLFQVWLLWPLTAAALFMKALSEPAK